MNDSRETKESTVGSFVQNLEFSEKEKDRIAAQLKEKSKIQEIFLANAQLTHSFQRIVKEIKVPGQSAGRKGHTKGALKIVTIHHYNVALASCYLVPTLKMWSLQPSFHQLSKLILIESNS